MLHHMVVAEGITISFFTWATQSKALFSQANLLPFLYTPPILPETRTNVSKSRVIKVLSSPEEEEQCGALLEPVFAPRRG